MTNGQNRRTQWLEPPTEEEGPRRYVEAARADYRHQGDRRSDADRSDRAIVESASGVD